MHTFELLNQLVTIALLALLSMSNSTRRVDFMEPKLPKIDSDAQEGWVTVFRPKTRVQEVREQIERDRCIEQKKISKN